MKTLIQLDILSNPHEVPKYTSHHFHCNCDLPLLPAGSGVQISLEPAYDQFADVILNYINPKDERQQVIARRVIEDQASADAVAGCLDGGGFWKRG